MAEEEKEHGDGTLTTLAIWQDPRDNRFIMNGERDNYLEEIGPENIVLLNANYLRVLHLIDIPSNSVHRALTSVAYPHLYKLSVDTLDVEEYDADAQYPFTLIPGAVRDLKLVTFTLIPDFSACCCNLNVLRMPYLGRLIVSDVLDGSHLAMCENLRVLEVKTLDLSYFVQYNSLAHVFKSVKRLIAICTRPSDSGGDYRNVFEQEEFDCFLTRLHHLEVVFCNVWSIRQEVVMDVIIWLSDPRSRVCKLTIHDEEFKLPTCITEGYYTSLLKRNTSLLAIAHTEHFPEVQKLLARNRRIRDCAYHGTVTLLAIAKREPWNFHRDVLLIIARDYLWTNRDILPETTTSTQFWSWFKSWIT